MLTLAIFKMAFIDHSPPAIVALFLAVAFFVALELGWFDSSRWW
jgi:hypothetical protein